MTLPYSFERAAGCAGKKGCGLFTFLNNTRRLLTSLDRKTCANVVACSVLIVCTAVASFLNGI